MIMEGEQRLQHRITIDSGYTKHHYSLRTFTSIIRIPQQNLWDTASRSPSARDSNSAIQNDRLLPHEIHPKPHNIRSNPLLRPLNAPRPPHRFYNFSPVAALELLKASTAFPAITPYPWHVHLAAAVDVPLLRLRIAELVARIHNAISSMEDNVRTKTLI